MSEILKIRECLHPHLYEDWEKLKWTNLQSTTGFDGVF